MRKFLLACLFFLVVVHPVFAVSVTILSAPSTIGEEKFSVTVQTDGASAGTNYLRVDLYQEGTTKYFGDTDNSQAWYNGSDGKQYFPITIISNTANIATVSARIGEPTQSDYPGQGSYKLRIRRYTSSGNQGSEDPSPVSITITKAWPSPSPTPTPTPTPTPSPSPTSTITPSPTPTPKPSIKPSPSPTSPAETISEDGSGTVAGESIEIDLSGFGTSPSPTNLSGVSRKVPVLNPTRARTALFVGSGLILTSLAGFFGYRKYLATMVK